MHRPVVCLLPARNEAEHLPAWFESVERFADAVVALDDGSTDGTGECLSSHPLVRKVLSNPRRDSYAGWDDSANRNRLLAAAAELRPRWIMQLDADERISADDAGALRALLEGDADPSCAYLFRVFRMIGDLDHHDPRYLWVGRLFAYEPGQRFPTDPLHFIALPTSIPRSRWLRTTIRIQHLAALTAEDRRRRLEKYREADPDERYHSSYSSYSRLLEGPREVRPWCPRSPHLPVLANTAKPEPAAVEDGPVLSAIVIARDDEDVIERAVGAVVGQVCPEPFEVVVVTSGTDRTADIVRARFPDVRLVELDRPALPGAARNAGLAVAKGRYVSFPGSHVELAPGSLAGRIRAHRLGWAMVTGSMLNGTRTWAGWASYFLDNSTSLPGRPSGPLEDLPVRCSYLRAALAEVGGFPEDLRAGEDTAVNGELWIRGYGAYRSQEVALYHHSPCRGVGRLVTHHFARGRGLGRLLVESVDPAAPYPSRGLVRYVVKGVPVRVVLIRTRVNRWAPELRWRLWIVSPFVVVGAVSAWAGACFELVRYGRRNGRGTRPRRRRPARRRSTAGPRRAAIGRRPREATPVRG